MSTPSRLPRPARPVRIRLELDEPDAQRLRATAGRAGLSMASYLRRVVLRDLDRSDRLDRQAPGRLAD